MRRERERRGRRNEGRQVPLARVFVLSSSYGLLCAPDPGKRVPTRPCRTRTLGGAPSIARNAPAGSTFLTRRSGDDPPLLDDLSTSPNDRLDTRIAYEQLRTGSLSFLRGQGRQVASVVLYQQPDSAARTFASCSSTAKPPAVMLRRPRASERDIERSRPPNTRYSSLYGCHFGVAGPSNVSRTSSTRTRGCRSDHPAFRTRRRRREGDAGCG